MAAVEETPFTNPQVDLATLPNYKDLHFHAINKRNLSKALLQTGIFALVLLTANLLIYVFFSLAFWFTVIAGVSALVVILLVTHCIFSYKAFGYALRGKDIAFKHGYIVEEITLIPFNRIQHVSTSRSFLDKLFTLSQLNIYTAGGQGSDVTIPGLTPDLAKQLKQELANKISQSTDAD